MIAKYVAILPVVFGKKKSCLDIVRWVYMKWRKDKGRRTGQERSSCEARVKRLFRTEGPDYKAHQLGQ